MTQTQPHNMGFALNSSQEMDIWINDTDDCYVVRVHIRHGEGFQNRTQPIFQTLVFEPHSETMVPREYRYDIHVYECGETECKNNPGTKLCRRAHEKSQIIVGGKAPMLKRKDAPHIPLSKALDTSLVEIRRIDRSNRETYEFKHPDELVRPTELVRAGSDEYVEVTNVPATTGQRQINQKVRGAK